MCYVKVVSLEGKIWLFYICFLIDLARRPLKMAETIIVIYYIVLSLYYEAQNNSLTNFTLLKKNTIFNIFILRLVSCFLLLILITTLTLLIILTFITAFVIITNFY